MLLELVVTPPPGGDRLAGLLALRGEPAVLAWTGLGDDRALPHGALALGNPLRGAGIAACGASLRATGEV